MINGLDLFSGIGGISLALSPWVRTIAYCEIDSYAQSVLLSRMSDGQISTAPIWPDVTTLVPGVLPRNGIDLISGGFPCQDISVAGNGAGLEGERSGLFYEIIRLVKEIEPAFVFLENVPAIRTRGLREIIREFTDIRYDCRWTCVSAAELGAPHIRKRWFLLAHSNRNGIRDESRGRIRQNGQNPPELEHDGTQGDVAHAESTVSQRLGTEPSREQSGFANPSWWTIEPDVGRVVDELPHRVDRIKGLGNAVVPIQAREAFKKLMGLEAQKILEGEVE